LVDDEILLSSPPIGSCTFDNHRREELETIIRDVVDDIGTTCKLRITSKMNSVLDEECKQRELQRCERLNAEYHRTLEFIRSHQNNDPVISYV